MKIKVILFALVIALLAGLAVPAFASLTAFADGGRPTRGGLSPAATTPVVQEPITASTTSTTTPLGPMMIGIQTSNNKFFGIAATIKLGGDGTLKLANIKGLSLDGTFRLSLAYDVAPAPGGAGSVVSGTLTSS